MEDQSTSSKERIEDKFRWTIENFSKFESKKKLYSESFFLDGHSWRILIFPKGNAVKYLSVYLDGEGLANLPYGWSKFANFKLTLINQVNTTMTKAKECEHEFNARESDWGFTTFIPLDEFEDSSNGFIVNDTCIIEAEICIKKSEDENQVDDAVPTQVCAEPINHSDNTTSFGELVDFRGLGKIEKAFVPLLEEVCSLHPSLIDSQQKRSRRFAEWALTALGRVLHFLKVQKAKDMNDEACNHLQILWEELEIFKFDLTWLEPHVQSALGMKSYIEKALEVKMMKEHVTALEMETKRLKAKIAASEVDLEMARRDLAKAEEGFKELDLDAELGYGGP
ncbi:MATH domain and coiled-coil domain-containing protein At3g58270-like [Abrus precatorius]|uniref:MATH domain and coiled-coil domain-containing protein At3g58270-like n=1 Tax=Abrus precatorius TaxID=3816 RepID=A0A8B8MF53_ABRPR|nr:MATH domain and coiled-coil domain-containing protein At3g58270-like [Abrus precatorius]